MRAVRASASKNALHQGLFGIIGYMAKITDIDDAGKQYYCDMLDFAFCLFFVIFVKVYERI